MYSVAISSTGLFVPPYVITNEELVEAFNTFAEQENTAHAAEIAAGTRAAIPMSSVEFIEKASGIKRRYVMEKEGVLDPQRMRPRFTPRPDTEISMMAEIAVAAAKQALERAGKTAADVDGVICASANMQRAYPAMAVEIQTALGIQGFGFDMNVACSSATFAIEMAANAVKCGSARAVLIVNPEITSAAPGLERPRLPLHFWGCVHRASWSNGLRVQRLPALLRFWAHNCRPRFSNNDPQQRRLHVAQPKTATRTTVTSCSTRKAARCSKKSVQWPPQHMSNPSGRRSIWSRPSDVRRFWLHQANLAMNQLIVPQDCWGATPAPDDAPVILNEFANTASAGSIIAFHRHHADFKSRRHWVSSAHLVQATRLAAWWCAAPERAPRLHPRPHASQRYSLSRFGTAARGQVCSARSSACVGSGTA
jgi:beta-ketodecanoyl-[acyl-carrier-protein] synthase